MAVYMQPIIQWFDAVGWVTAATIPKSLFVASGLTRSNPT